MARLVSTIPGTDLFSDENMSQMDETVKEIFSTMLGMEISAHSRASSQKSGEHTAQIGFCGIISGHCEINLSRNASTAVASAMLGGMEVDEKSDAVCDAVGELCNMLAGGWKDRLPTLSSACHITVPVRSCDLHQHEPGKEPTRGVDELLLRHRSYTFEGRHLLEVTLAHAR